MRKGEAGRKGAKVNKIKILFTSKEGEMGRMAVRGPILCQRTAFPVF